MEKQVPDAHYGLIKDLQIAHDRDPVRMWRYSLKDVAQDYRGPMGERLNTDVLGL
jgi:hypothetical protein